MIDLPTDELERKKLLLKQRENELNKARASRYWAERDDVGWLEVSTILLRDRIAELQAAVNEPSDTAVA